MPRGIYVRTKKIRAAIARARIGTKTSPETKAKLSIAAQRNRLSSEWIEKVKRGTLKAWKRPGVKQRHLRAVRRYVKNKGVNFRGGNGQKPVQFVLDLEKILKPAGWIREYSIGVPGNTRNYKVDLAHVAAKVAIECDGPSHHQPLKKNLDAKKTKILKSLGWKVIRIPYGNRS
jgi:Protein of unknown function (DUF559)